MLFELSDTLPSWFDTNTFSFTKVFLSPDEAAYYFAKIRDEITWQTRTISLHGKEIAIPRLSKWYGACGYTYSGICHPPDILPSNTFQLMRYISLQTGITELNGCLANLYRNGNDSVAWHKDDEPELDARRIVAIISLGCARHLHIREDATGRKVAVLLPSGSLFVMREGFNELYSHAILKEPKITSERISLTFRIMRNVRP